MTSRIGLLQRQVSADHLSELVADVEASLGELGAAGLAPPSRLPMVALQMGKLLGYLEAVADFEPSFGVAAANQARALTARMERLRDELTGTAASASGATTADR